MLFFNLIEVLLNHNHPQFEIISSALNLLQRLYNYSANAENYTKKSLHWSSCYKLSHLIQQSHRLHTKIHLHFSLPETNQAPAPTQQEGWDPSSNTITIATISSQLQLISKLIKFLYTAITPWLADPEELATILARSESFSYFGLSLRLAAYYYHHLPSHQTVKEIQLASKDQYDLMCSPILETGGKQEIELTVEEFLRANIVSDDYINVITEKTLAVTRNRHLAVSRSAPRQEIIELLEKTDQYLAASNEHNEAQPAAKKCKPSI